MASSDSDSIKTYDPDVVAILYFDCPAGAETSLSNCPWYSPPEPQPQMAGSASRFVRDPVDDGDDSQEPRRRDKSSLEFRLDMPFHSKWGLLIGSSPQCDLRVEGGNLSRLHCGLFLNENGYPVVKDFGSRGGTAVEYGDHDTEMVQDNPEQPDSEGKRRNFEWIVGGPDVEQPAHINLGEDENGAKVRLQVVVPPRQWDDQTFRARVHGFRRHSESADPVFTKTISERIQKRLDAGTSRLTALPTGPYYVAKDIGHGSSAVVFKVWNVSTGKIHSIKQPPKSQILKSEYDAVLWHREIENWRNLGHHDNIVEFLRADFDENGSIHPRIHLEFREKGNIAALCNIKKGNCNGRPLAEAERKERLTEAEALSVTRQCLSAVSYMHSHGIVHRDIKPENVLLQARDTRTGFIKVQLCDMSAAKRGYNLNTHIGTGFYQAPEVSRGNYDSLVDIWSLGVMAFTFFFNFPKEPRNAKSPSHWCERVETEVERMAYGNHMSAVMSPSTIKLMKLIAEYMVRKEPEDRLSAADCLGMVEGIVAETQEQPAEVQRRLADVGGSSDEAARPVPSSGTIFGGDDSSSNGESLPENNTVMEESDHATVVRIIEAPDTQSQLDDVDMEDAPADSYVSVSMDKKRKRRLTADAMD